MTNTEFTNRPESVDGRVAWRMVALLSVAELLGMTLWFSATAVAPSMIAEFRMTESQAAWLTMAVQAGFVAGTLASAALNLSDIINARWLFGACCLIGAAANAAVAQASGPVEAVALRFATGAALAGVYPPGMKIVAGWIAHQRGAALGLLVGALTLGSAFPHLLASIPGGSWRSVVLIASSLAVVGGAIVVLLIGDGPHVTSTAPFNPHAAMRVFTRRATRLALFGYLGHMWELYAMWTWIATFVAASVALHEPASASRTGSLGAFLAIGSGALGCVMAGLLADRVGKARVAAWSMMVSATCAALTVIVFTLPPSVVFALVIVWGFSIVADSAQFSALVSQFSPRDYVGTALTAQTCAGFLLTLLPIRLLPTIAVVVGWRWTFLVLLPGPMLGVLAMLGLMRGPQIVESR